MWALTIFTGTKGRTQYTPRADYDKSSLTNIIKPADNGYLPMNTLKPLYEGPDEHNPNFDIPVGEIDVASIVSNRRRLESTLPGVIGSARAITVNTDLKFLESTSTFNPRRRVDEVISPGKGWEVIDEPQGLCDGTYEGQCGHSGNNDCFLSGHHCARGAVIGNEWSGWLVLTLKDLKFGLIVVKLHTWHNPDEQLTTAGWTSVNGERRRLGSPNEMPTQPERGISDASLETDNIECDMGRSLKMRSYDTPALPDTFMFDFAINGKITSLNGVEFLAQKHDVARVVETLTLLDDPNFTKDPEDVEVAFRLRGSGRQLVFGISHIYWA